MKAHLGGAYEGGDANTITEDCWGYLLVKYNVKSVLDIGCGYGHALKWFGKFQIVGTGIDGYPDCITKSVYDGPLIRHDFNDGPAPLGDQRFDLAWSAEALEHIDIVYSENYMDAFRRCKHAVITHAAPGQDGHHHVACFPDSFWQELFEKNGFRFDAEETALLRQTDRWHASWGRVSLMSFHNDRLS